MRPQVCARLQPLVDVGLDYVRLGSRCRRSPGGEAQRLKLAGHLAEAALGAQPRARAGQAARRDGCGTRGKLLLFDEPTTGLHFEDIAQLMRALRKLLDAGHSLLVIEHNLDVIRAADWIIDLGPEGGERRRRDGRRRHRPRRCAAHGSPRQLAHRPGAARLRHARQRGAAAAAARRGRAAAARGCRRPRMDRCDRAWRARAQSEEHRRRRSRATASP